MTTPDERWATDAIQFPRLLAEIAAVGLTPEQGAGLAASMDLTPGEIAELFTRAEAAWGQQQAAQAAWGAGYTPVPGLKCQHCDRLIAPHAAGGSTYWIDESGMFNCQKDLRHAPMPDAETRS